MMILLISLDHCCILYLQSQTEFSLILCLLSSPGHTTTSPLNTVASTLEAAAAGVSSRAASTSVSDHQLRSGRAHALCFVPDSCLLNRALLA